MSITWQPRCALCIYSVSQIFSGCMYGPFPTSNFGGPSHQSPLSHRPCLQRPQRTINIAFDLLEFNLRPKFFLVHSFIHSGHFYRAPSSPLPLRGAPDYSTDTVSEFHAEAHRQLHVKDLPKVPT